MTEIKSIHDREPVPVNTNTVSAGWKEYLLDSKQCVLGGLMLDNSKYQAVSTILDENDFNMHDSKIIYSMIRSQADKGSRSISSL